MSQSSITQGISNDFFSLSSRTSPAFNSFLHDCDSTEFFDTMTRMALEFVRTFLNLFNERISDIEFPSIQPNVMFLANKIDRQLISETFILLTVADENRHFL